MSKKENILGVTFEDTSHPVVDSNASIYYIPFDKTEEYFDVYENYVKFVKACESLVRKHKFYKTYIKYLIDVVGMNTCQVLPGTEVEEGKSKKVTIEMHHGPILTLFDICSIVLNAYIKRGTKNITTFMVADTVIEEHRLNHVRVILLSKSVHDQVHLDNIQLNYQMGFGDTQAFLEKWNDGLDDSMKKNINEYIEWSKKNDSFDNDVLALSEHMKIWGNNDFNEFDDIEMKDNV